MEEWEGSTSIMEVEQKDSSATSATMTDRSCENLDCYMILSREEKIVIGTMCSLAGPFTLLENMLVLVVIAATATLRQKPSYLFIGSLALADVFASCFFTIIFIEFHVFHRRDDPTDYLFKLGGVIMSFTGSVGSLLLTALDRYLCIHQAPSYKVLLTRRRALLGMLALWSATIFIAFLPLMGWRCQTDLNPPCSLLFPYIPVSYLVCWTSFILVGLALILVAYARILWKAHRHEASMNGLHAVSGSGQARRRMDIRLARTFGLVLLILVGCWLPVLCFMLVDSSVRLNLGLQRAFAFCSILCLVNSLVNPLLYALRCKEMRVALQQLVRRLGFHKTTDTTPTVSSREANSSISQLNRQSTFYSN